MILNAMADSLEPNEGPVRLTAGDLLATTLDEDCPELVALKAEFLELATHPSGSAPKFKNLIKQALHE
jgi:hypothetical protein